jgi:hypothetical protein
MAPQRRTPGKRRRVTARCNALRRAYAEAFGNAAAAVNASLCAGVSGEQILFAAARPPCRHAHAIQAFAREFSWLLHIDVKRRDQLGRTQSFRR